MNPKQIAVIIIISALVGGISGAIVSTPVEKDLAQFDEIIANKITAKIINGETISTTADDNQHCIITGGRIEATESIKTGVLKGEGLEVYQVARLRSIKADSIFSRNIMAARNPLEAKTEDVEILAQLMGTENGGGRFILRSNNGPIQPNKGEASTGYQLIFGYDENGYPTIFSENNQTGPDDRNYVLRFATGDGEVKADK